MIAFSCVIKISAVHCLVLSQSTHVTDGQTDRITTPKTAKQYLVHLGLKNASGGSHFKGTFTRNVFFFSLFTSNNARLRNMRP